MSTKLVSWIGNHYSSVDGRLIQVAQTREFTDEGYRDGTVAAFIVELSADKSNSCVKLWELVEAYPYRYDGTSSEVDL
jgi:hypothetical protein